MIHRDFSKFASANSEVRDLLSILAEPTTPVEDYRQTMLQLGRYLAAGILSDGSTRSFEDKDICVVCTVEDADFLAKGVMEGLMENGVASERLHLYCFWNERIRSNGVSLSPIVRQYEETFDSQQPTYILVKSIISGACVVKTNLTRVLEKAGDADVFVVSPVLLSGAQSRLEREFPSSIAQRFKYVWFATDHAKDKTENVVPGIGGSVYERLGLGENKNKYVPQIVKERRSRLYGAPLSA